MRREIQISYTQGNRSPSIANVLETLNVWLQTIPFGEWTIRLEKVKKKRSLSQNALLWAWMTALSKEWAAATDQHYTKEQFKEMFARMFLPVSTPTGDVVGGSTSTLTLEQMTEFLTKIQVYVAEQWGITLLNAEDRMFNEWYSQYEED